MRRISELMRDQQHLRSPSRHLDLYQRGLADIALAAFASALALSYVIIRVVNSILRNLTSPPLLLLMMHEREPNKIKNA